MKRSEMVNRLTQVLLPTGESNHVTNITEEWADLLLTEIEQAGMLPPMKPIPKYAFQAEHEWEPESECKNCYGLGLPGECPSYDGE